MIYRRFSVLLLWRVLLLTLFLAAGIYLVLKEEYALAVISLFVVIGILVSIFYFLQKRLTLVYDFFEAVKYRDFSQNFVVEKKANDLQQLYRGFNLVNATVRTIQAERETQFLYLQKILEMIDIGIMAYDTTSGRVMWLNEAFLKIIDQPHIKQVQFVEKRNPELYRKLFIQYYAKPENVALHARSEGLSVLVSNSLFRLEDQECKLIVLHNIENTLNQTEAEAWKKLLSVMTHEIMNSIGPISSLAATLRQQAEGQQLDAEDLAMGLQSIENRSEGLMRFAKTYRSLNKVVNLHLEKVSVAELFQQLEHLMKPTAEGAKIRFELENKRLTINADAYLIEQVLINLILNAVQASERRSEAKVFILAKAQEEGKVLIQVVDNGAGIAADIQDKIFVPFFTTKKAGSGVGLSLSKQIMTLHGGKIQVQSEVGLGTRVSLVFNG